MRVHTVTPIRVDAEELNRRRERYARLAPPGVTCHVQNVPAGAPTQLGTQDAIDASTSCVTAAVGHPQHDVDGVLPDYVLPDCVLDPAVPLVPDGAAVPIVGMLRLTASHLVATGRRFGAVARNRAIADALAARVAAYGLGPWFAGTTVLDLDFDAVADATRWNTAVHEALDGFAAQGVGSVVNGCSAVDVAAPHEVELIDPAALALRLLAPRGGTA